MSAPKPALAPKEELCEMIAEILWEFDRRKKLWPAHVLAGKIREEAANRKMRLLQDAADQLRLLSEITYFETGA